MCGSYMHARYTLEQFVAALGQEVKSVRNLELAIVLVNDSSIRFYSLTNLERSRGMLFDAIDV